MNFIDRLKRRLKRDAEDFVHMTADVIYDRFLGSDLCRLFERVVVHFFRNSKAEA